MDDSLETSEAKIGLNAQRKRRRLRVVAVVILIAFVVGIFIALLSLTHNNRFARAVLNRGAIPIVDGFDWRGPDWTWLKKYCRKKDILTFTPTTKLYIGRAPAGLDDGEFAYNLKANAHFDDADMEEIAGYFYGMKDIRTVYIFESKLTSAGIGMLRKLPSLTDLSIVPPASIDEDGIRQIATFPALESLQLDGVKLAFDDFRHLQQLRTLRVLRLSDTSISDASLRAIGRVSQLETLALDNTEITDDGMAAFKGLPRLEMLSLDKTEIGNQGLVKLLHCPEIVSLGLAGTRINDDSAETLIGLQKLEKLDVSNTSVTDMWLRQVGSGIPSLKSVWLNKTNISKREVLDFRLLGPRKVFHDIDEVSD